jgi:type II secretory pathway pseudopilin PulG
MPASSNYRSSRKRSRNEGGFSVLELMVALLLFSALGIAVWSALAGGQNLVRRSSSLAAGTARLLQMELYLRRTAALVRTPFWAPGPGAEQAEGSLRVPWLDGQPEESLYLDWREGRLQVRTRKQEPGAVFGPFASVECGVYSGGPGGAAGLRVTILADTGDGQPLVILTPFGGSPFAPGTGP